MKSFVEFKRKFKLLCQDCDLFKKRHELQYQALKNFCAGAPEGSVNLERRASTWIGFPTSSAIFLTTSQKYWTSKIYQCSICGAVDKTNEVKKMKISFLSIMLFLGLAAKVEASPTCPDFSGYYNAVRVGCGLPGESCRIRIEQNGCGSMKIYSGAGWPN